MIWGIAFTVLIVALLIPILAVLRESPAFRRGAEPPALPSDADRQIEQLARRMQLLEDELDDLARTVDQVRDDTQFLQQLLENPDQGDRPPRRPPR